MSTDATAPVAAQATDADEFQSIIDKLSACDRTAVQRLEGLYALVRVSVHRWRGRHQIHTAEVVIGGDDLSAQTIASKPYWHLEPPAWKAKFDAIEHQKDEILKIYSKPSRQLAGVRVVLADKLEECCARLRALETKLLDAADDFTSEKNYQAVLTYVEEQLGNKPAALQEATRHIPPRNKMRGRYRMEQFVVPTALPDWANEGDDFHSKQLRESERKLLASNLATLTQQPRSEMADALWSDDPAEPRFINQLVTKDKHGKFQAKARRRISRDTVNALRNELEGFINFDDAVDDRTLDLARLLHEDLGELVDGMALEVDNGHRLTINADDAFALGWAARLDELYRWLRDPAKVADGLTKFCREAGVKV